MNNFARAHDQYLTPPEEPEAVLCDDCGEEMNDDKSGTLVCYNQFCPAKFEGVAREMADQLVWATDEIKSLAAKVKRLGMKPSNHNHVFIGGKCAHCGIDVSEIKSA